MLSWKELATAGAFVAFGAALLSAGGLQPPKPNVAPQIEQRFEIPAAPSPFTLWLASGTARPLGVALRELSPADAKARKLPTQTGMLVETVQPKGAAEKAGLRPGDVILEINGEPVRSIAQVRRLVNETPLGQAAIVSVFREGKKLAVSVVPDSSSLLRQRLDDLRRDLQQGRRYLFWSDPSPHQGNWPESPDLAPGPPFLQPRRPLFEWSPGADRLGVVVQELGPQLAEYFKVKGGVLIASVTHGSPAQLAGLKAGDVITAVDGQSVNARSDLLRMIRGMPDEQELSFSIARNGSPVTIKVKLGSAKGTGHV